MHLPGLRIGHLQVEGARLLFAALGPLYAGARGTLDDGRDEGTTTLRRGSVDRMDVSAKVRGTTPTDYVTHACTARLRDNEPISPIDATRAGRDVHLRTLLFERTSSRRQNDFASMPVDREDDRSSLDRLARCHGQVSRIVASTP
jgi:hypothetical protein